MFSICEYMYCTLGDGVLLEGFRRFYKLSLPLRTQPKMFFSPIYYIIGVLVIREVIKPIKTRTDGRGQGCTGFTREMTTEVFLDQELHVDRKVSK